MSIAEQFRSARHVSLTTYKKDGTPVATPVWLAVDGAEGTARVLDDASTQQVRKLIAGKLTMRSLRLCALPPWPRANCGQDQSSLGRIAAATPRQDALQIGRRAAPGRRSGQAGALH